jgi:hypothetical protein
MVRLLRVLTASCLFLCLVQSGFGSNSSLKTKTLPIVFEANRGQVAAKYRYLLRRDGMEALFASDGVDFAMTDRARHRGTVRMAFAGTQSEPHAEEELEGHANYFIGDDSSRWLRNVPLSARVAYKELYPGISAAFYGNGEELEYDFVVNPGADAAQIGVAFTGATSMTLNDHGDLLLRSAGGDLSLRKPVAYQMIGDVRRSVDAALVANNDGAVHFMLGIYDHSLPLVIDPVYVFSSYLGGTGGDFATAVTTDSAGNILVTGYTSSTDFPTAHAEQGALGGCDPYAGCQNAFITKIDPTGKTLIFSTYLGGSLQDRADAIAVDGAGNVIVGGIVTSADFPQAGNVSSLSCAITSECFFLASLSPDGSKLNYAGAVGGHAIPGSTDGDDVVLAVDAVGNAYLSSDTWDPQFAITPGTLASSFAGYPYYLMFVLKVDNTGKLIYSTPVPGTALYDPTTNNNAFTPWGMSVDSSGQVTIVGTAGEGLPTTAGVVSPQFPNATVNVSSPYAGFVLQINSTASAITMASYLPGTDVASGVATDSAGNLWITGSTTETTLPVGANAFQKTPTVSQYGSIQSGYIMDLNSGATSVLKATYLDGSSQANEEYSSFARIALDSHSNVFVGGTTGSMDFPLVDPFMTEFETASFYGDMVVAEMSSDLSAVKFGSFFSSVDPGIGGSYFVGLAIDSSDHLIAVGTTNSLDYPTTTSSFEPQLPPPASPFSSPVHTFVTKIDLSTAAPSACFDQFGVNFGNVNANQSATQTVHLTNCGNANLNLANVTSTDPTVVPTAVCSTLAPGAVCPITLTYTPISSNAASGTVTLTDNAVTVPQSITFAGQGIASKISPSSNPFSLGHILVGNQGPATTLFIYNQGQAPLVISNVVVNGAAFSIASNNCTSAPTPYGCSLQLTCAPIAAGVNNGSLVISSNDPVTPKLTVALVGTGDSTFAVPVLGTVTTPTVLMGTDTKLGVQGSNFYPESIAYLGETALTTTFTDNSGLQVTIPASSITSLGDQPLSVKNPMPGGGSSNALMITPYMTLNVGPSFLVSVPATGLVYASIPAAASSDANTVLAIDPNTGTTKSVTPVGNTPVLLAASSDGAYLFVGNRGDQTVQRIDLTTNAVEKTFPYTANIYCSGCTTPDATDLATVPGNPKEVILAQGGWMTLYNDAGVVNYVPNDGVCCYADPTFGSIAIAGNPMAVYALPFTIDGKFFQVANLTSSGLQYTRYSETNYGGDNTTGNGLTTDGTLLYTSVGQIWDPVTRTKVGTFPVKTINATSYPNSRNLTVDSATGEIYQVGELIDTNSSGVVVSAFGIKSHTLDATLQFPQVQGPIEYNIVRWGSDGLAFIGPSTDNTSAGLYLLRSSFVSANVVNPTPVLSAILPTSVPAGGAAFTLTVTGSGFIASSVINCNGTAVTTAYVNSGKLTATVPASAIAQSGTAQIAVFNPAPGGGSSVAQYLLIGAPSLGLSSSQIAFPDQVEGVTSSAKTVTLTNSGTFALSIQGVSATGDFNASSQCGTSLAANASCTVSVTFTPTAVGSRTGTLTIADNAAGNPHTVSISGNGTAAFTIGAAQSGSMTAMVTSGSTASYSLSLVGAAGFAGAVNLSCNGAPLYAACTLSPTSVTLPSGGTDNFTVNVTTSVTQTSQLTRSTTVALAGMGLAGLVVLSFASGLRRRVRGLLMMLAAGLVISAGLTSCGGSGSGGGGGSHTTVNDTAPGTYSLTLTATASGASASQTLTLVVK